MIETTLPVLILKDDILLPNNKAIIHKDEITFDGEYCLVIPNDYDSNNKGIGVIAHLEFNDDDVMVMGLYRAMIITFEYLDKSPVSALIKPIKVKESDACEQNALKDIIISKCLYLIENSSMISNSFIRDINVNNSLYKLVDIISYHLIYDMTRKKEYLQATDIILRAGMLIDDMDDMLNGLEKDEHMSEVAVMKKKLSNLKLDSVNHQNILNKIMHYQTLKDQAVEGDCLRWQLKWILTLPFNTLRSMNLDYKKVMNEVNDRCLFLNRPKAQILKHIMVGNMSKRHLCVTGRPGTGKKTLIKSVAEALKLDYIYLDLNDMLDEGFLFGKEQKYVGNVMSQVTLKGSSNPIILLDHVDEVLNKHDHNLDRALSKLMNIEYLEHFYDKYLEIDFDLSKAVFVYSVTDTSILPSYYESKMEVIHIPGYTNAMKKDIVNVNVLDNILNYYQLDRKVIKVSDNALMNIITHYTSDLGLNETTSCLNSIISSLKYRTLIDHKLKKFDLDDTLIQTVLGPYKYLTNSNHNLILDSGLENNQNIELEGINYDGNGTLTVINDKCIEQFKLAYAFLLTEAKYFKLDIKDLKQLSWTFNITNELNIEDNELSASIVIKMLSLLYNYTIRNDVSVLGGINLNGALLKTAHLETKIILAINRGIKVIYISVLNQNELNSIDINLKTSIAIKLIDNIKEIGDSIYEK